MLSDAAADLQRAHIVPGAKNEPDAMRQGGPQDGLVNEIGGPDLIGLGDGCGIVVARDHDDRDIDSRAHEAQRRAQVETVAARQFDVKQHYVGFVVLKRGNGIPAVGGNPGVEAGLLKSLAGQERERWIIVNDQHAPSRVTLEWLHRCSIIEVGRRRNAPRPTTVYPWTRKTVSSA